MKQSQSPIWQKKRKRKFKNTRKPQQKVSPEKKILEVPVKQPSEQKKETTSSKKSFFSHWFHKTKETKEKVHKPPHVAMWIKRYDSDIQLILFPLILLVILFILYVFNDQLFHNLSKQVPISNNLTTLNPYPYVEKGSLPQLSSQAAIILDRNSQVILFSKNPQLRFSLASTTKIMTAMIALHHYKPDDILTVKRSYVEGSALNFYYGEQLHFIDLMYAMLLPSANDAAQAIADNYPGGETAFVAQMNTKANSLHLYNTHYADPIGLVDDGDYSTVVDMAHLASYAITNPTFAQIVSTKYKTISDVNFTRQYQLTNLNELLGVEGVNGIKTGNTEGAKEVLVTSAVKNGHAYIIVVMDGNDWFGDTLKLLKYIDTNVQYIVPPVPQGNF